MLRTTTTSTPIFVEDPQHHPHGAQRYLPIDDSRTGARLLVPLDEGEDDQEHFRNIARYLNARQLHIALNAVLDDVLDKDRDTDHVGCLLTRQQYNELVELQQALQRDAHDVMQAYS